MIAAHKENEEEEQKYYVDKEATLILRILDYKNEYLLWIYDFDVPFTNNLSERGLRGAKSKMKVAGQFWNVESASWYATIRTYIETCNRNNIKWYKYIEWCLENFRSSKSFNSLESLDDSRYFFRYIKYFFRIKT